MKGLQAARIVKRLGLAGGIRFLVDRIHVGTPDMVVAENIQARVSKAFRKPQKLGPDAARLGPRVCAEACALYAIMVHHSNRRGYRRVVSGRL